MSFSVFYDDWIKPKKSHKIFESLTKKLKYICVYIYLIFFATSMKIRVELTWVQNMDLDMITVKYDLEDLEAVFVSYMSG